MGLIKIFSGNKILAQSLQKKIEEAGFEAVIRINNQANVFPSLLSDKAVEVFIEEKHFGKINPILDEFRMSI